MQISYFPHDSNARNSDKLLPVRMKYGAEGYGIYFMLLERLRDEPTYTSVKDYNMLAFDLRVDAQKIKAVIEDFGLFAFTDDGKCFYSEGFMKRMEIKDSKSKARSIAGKKGAEKRWNEQNNSKAIAMPSSNNSKAMAMPYQNDSKKSKVKESKGNKTKVNDSNDDDGAHDLLSTVSAINHWQEVYGGLNAVQMEDLQSYRLEFQDELVNEAINRTARAVSANQRGGAFTYMAKILKSWQQAGVKNLDDVTKADKRYEQTKSKPTYSNGYKRPEKKEIATDWSKKKPEQTESPEELEARIDKMMALMDGETHTETGE